MCALNAIVKDDRIIASRRLTVNNAKILRVIEMMVGLLSERK